MESRETPWDLEGLLDRYCYERVLRSDTMHSYARVVRIWIRDTGIRDVRNIDHNSVLQWRRKVLARARPSTWNTYRRHMRALLVFACKQGLIAQNPFEDLPAVKESAISKLMEIEDISRAIEYLESPACVIEQGWLWATIVKTFYYSGIRRHQLVGIRWRDVQLHKKIWTMRAETSKNHQDLVLPIAEPLIPDLERLHENTRNKLHKPIPGRHQVFCVPLFSRRLHGQELTRNQLSAFFARLSQIMGFQITPHRIRYTVATMLARSGDLRTVQNLLGHASITSTMRYVHPSPDRLRELLAHLPELQ